MIRTPLRPLAKIISARAAGRDPGLIEAENLRSRHKAMREAERHRAESRLVVLGLAVPHPHNIDSKRRRRSLQTTSMSRRELSDLGLIWGSSVFNSHLLLGREVTTSNPCSTASEDQVKEYPWLEQFFLIRVIRVFQSLSLSASR